MGEGVWEIKEERGAFRVTDELCGFFGVLAGEGSEVGLLLDDGGIAQENAGSHVVAVGDAEVVVEAPFGGEVLRGGTEVPFADTLGLVTLCLEEVGESLFVEVEAHFVLGEEDGGDTDPGGISTGEQGRARG